MFTVHATITFHIPVSALPPDGHGSSDPDADVPITGAEQVAGDFLLKLQQVLPDGVYPMLNACSASAVQTTPL